MPLDDDAIRRLFLSGAVRLPCPAPLTGTVEIIRHPFPLSAKKVPVPDQDYVVISWELPGAVKVTCSLRTQDVRSISGTLETEAHNTLKNLGWDLETSVHWHQKELQTVVDQLLENLDNRLIPLVKDAVIHVPESAPVLLDVQRGVVAAEICDLVGFKPCDHSKW